MRIFLPKDRQKRFIESVLLKISIADVAKLCGLTERTIRDWRRGKFLMQKNAVIRICENTGIAFPKDYKEKEDFWYVNKGASLGGKIGSMVCLKKYGHVGGDPEKRKLAWYKWWNCKGKLKNHLLFIKKNLVKRPKKSGNLSEFIGIMLGDGGMASHGYQINITLNNHDDKEYIKFVSRIICRLFGKKPSIIKRKDSKASVILVSSVDLVSFLVELGLKKGNKIKLQVDIPDWIKNNKDYSIACVRGLIDTDGCVFNHRYKVNGKIYNYKKLTFTCYSEPMRISVFNILTSLGINSRLSSYRDIRIDSQKDVKKYFEVVGTHNPKHLKRYHK